MRNKLTVSCSPHFRDEASTSSIMREVIIALIPALLVGIYVFGLRALVLTVACIASSLLFEYIFTRWTGRPTTIGDLSAVVTGMLLAMNLPVTLPVWMAVLGSAVAILVAKCLFGGIGQNFANPAILARCVLLISFAKPMTNWLIPHMTAPDSWQVAELVSGATPLALLASGNLAELPNYYQMALGFMGGCIGEVSKVALLVGGCYLVYRKVITATTPLVYLGTVALLALVLQQNVAVHLLSGGLMIGAIYMATDYSSSPMSEKGKAVFAVGCGVVTMLIRVYGAYPEGVSFAILLMNTLTPYIDTLTKTKPFGGVKK